MMNMLLGPLKASVELICGEEEAASRTWSDFTRTNPLVVPARLVYDLTDDNPGEAMKKTCKTFGGAIDNMANSTPLVGHVKGGLTCIVNKDKGLQILNQATRTTAVAGAGIGGFVIGGPVVAAVLAAGTGAEYDGVASIVTKEGRGTLYTVAKAIDGKKVTAGEWFDSVASPVVDGATGVAAGKTYSKVKTALDRKKEVTKLENKVKDQGVDNPKEVVKEMRKQGKELKDRVTQNEDKLLQQMKDEKNKTSVNDLSERQKKIATSGHTKTVMKDADGNTGIGYSKRLCIALGIDRFESLVSKLQQTFPHIKQVMNRALETCAEHMAFDKLASNPVVTFAVQIRDGMIYAVERCKNCAQYPLGNVITDGLNGSWIPEPGYCSSALAGAAITSGTLFLTFDRNQRKEKLSN